MSDTGEQQHSRGLSQLPQGSHELLHTLSRYCHQSWKRARQESGWQFAPHYDANALTDPRLDDFENLGEMEMQRWQRESEHILAAISDAGFDLVAPDRQLVGEALDGSQLQGLRFRELLDLYQRHREEWRAVPENFLRLGEALLQRSEAVSAYEVFRAGIDVVEHAAQCDLALRRRLLQKAAQALADARAMHESEQILAGLYAGGARDGETMGLWAKVHKRMAIENGDEQALKMGLRLYREGYETAEACGAVDDAIYNGINAATMARLAGNSRQSRAIIARVRQLCLDKEQRSYWDEASLGECSLLEGELDAAIPWYRAAAATAPLRDRLSMWQQVTLICDRLELPVESLRELFAPPSVLVFCGHRLDDDRSGFERFPAWREDEISSRLRQHIAELNPGFAYCSAMCGSDLMFIEAMLAHGAEVHVYLPFAAPHFAEEYVAYAGKEWLDRFRAALEQVDSVTTVSQWDLGLNDRSHSFCNLYLFGAALLQHRNSGCALQGLTVWDGIDDSLHSGTAAMINIWREYGLDWRSIQPGGHGCFDADVSIDADREDGRHIFLPMLFADVKGYSRLSGRQLYVFARRFMDACANVIGHHGDGVFSTRTQGDSLFIVFKDLATAVSTARELRDMINGTDWAESGLPADLSARLALDCGPCYDYRDPVTGRRELCGAHVIRAARLEPVTPPGHIYASESFATLCAAKKVDACFEAAGRIVLPKSYGEMRVYHLR